MAEMNEIFTRIQLKYDSYTAWKTNNPTLLAGEVAIAKLVDDVTIPVDEQKNAPVLFKVGPGKFNDLPWASALAADVYAWAKQATLPVVRAENDGTEGNVISSIKFENDKVVYTTASVATSEGMEELQEELSAVKKDIDDNRDAWNLDTDTRYTFTTDGDKLVVKKALYTNGVAGNEEEVGTYEFLTSDEVDALIGKANITIKGADGLTGEDTFNVNATENKTITINHAEAGSVTTNSKGTDVKVVTGTSRDKFGHIVGDTREEIKITAGYKGVNGYGAGLAPTIVTKIGEQEDGTGLPVVGSDGISVTVHNFTEGGSNQTGLLIDGSELLQNAKDYTDAEIAKAHANVVDYRGVANALADLSEDAGKGDFYRVGTEIKSGDTILAYAGDLIVAEKDKPAQQIDGTNWTAIHCGDGDISEVVAGDGLTGGGATGSVTIGLSDATKASLGNADTAYGWGDHAQEGYLKAGDIANKADKVTGATAGNFAGLDAKGNLTDSGYNAGSFATSEQGAKADAAIRELRTDHGLGAFNVEIVYGDDNSQVGTPDTSGAVKIHAYITDEGVDTQHLADKAVTAAKLADDVKELIKTEAATLDTVVLAESQKYTDGAIDDLHAIATSGSIYDVKEGSTANNGTDKDIHPKYLIFNCGSSTTVI